MSESLFFNGKILTFDIENEFPEAVLVKDGRVVKTGSYHLLKNEIKDPQNRIDLQGRVLLPAICDVHTHFYEMAKFARYIDLSQANSVAEMEAQLQAYRQNLKEKPNWIRGWGWSLNRYPDAQYLNKQLLDRIFPDIPVTFDSHDLHSKWCNSLALKIADIDAQTPNPEGGEISKGADGEPDGILRELAWNLINRVVPDFTFEEEKAIIRESVEKVWQYGISGVHFMEGEDRFYINKALVEEGLNFRFFWHFPSEMLDDMINRKSANDFKIFDNTLQNKDLNDFLQIMGMKVFMDGSLGSKTAYMYDPYPDSGAKANYGRLTQSFQELYHLMYKAGKAGISSTVHAIGDRCCHELIQCFIRLNEALNVKLNHRIEHLQSLYPNDLPYLKQSGVSCAIQPVHMKEDLAFIEKIWPKAAAWSYPVKSLLDFDIPFAFSSDAPVETINPFEGIYSAVERRSHNHPQNPSWRPEECINSLQALEAYTKKASIMSGMGEKTGMIKTAYFADFMILNDFFTQESIFWLTAKSHLTMIHGEVVYRDF